MTWLLIFAGAVVLWWLVATVADAIAGGRRTGLPDRVTVRIVPGWLPSYVRQDLARARAARARAARARHDA